MKHLIVVAHPAYAAAKLVCGCDQRGATIVTIFGRWR
jgi:hypothetical protein